MRLAELIAALGHLARQHAYLTKEVVALTPHGSYLFDLQGAEWDKDLDSYVLRLLPREDLRPHPTKHTVTITPDGTIFVEHSQDCANDGDGVRSRCNYLQLARVALDGGHLGAGTWLMEKDRGTLTWEAKA